MGEFYNKPGVSLKLGQLILCIASTVLINIYGIDDPIKPGALNRFIAMSMTVAAPNSIIVIVVLLTLIFLEVDYEITELCLLGAAGALNLTFGIVIIHDIENYYDRSNEISLGAPMIIGGIMMFIDVIRIINSWQTSENVNNS